MFQEHFLSLPEIDQIANHIRSLLEKEGWRSQPRVGLILGSGLGNLADSVQDSVTIPYSQIPGWPVSTVVGHAGKLIFGRLENQDVVAMQGRAHFYEGYSINQVGLPTRVLQRLGIEILPLYTPIHLKPEYSHYSVSLPETETAYKKILQIPVEPSMSDRVFSKIINGFAFFREGLDQKRIIDPNGLQSDTLLKRNEVVK